LTFAGPTMLAVETDSAWLVILAVSLVTLPAVVLLRRLIGRPGGLASGVVLALPLALPLLAAVIFSQSVLPEVSVLKPVTPALLRHSGDLLLLLLSDGRGRLITYALIAQAGPWLLLIGGAISSIMLLRRGLGHLAVRRVVARCRPVETYDESLLLDVTERLALLAGLRTIPRVLLIDDERVGAFATAGRRPAIVLSSALVEALDESELEGLIAHEIAHIEAHDVPLTLTTGVLRDLVGWNPIAHLAHRRLVADREFEADRRAVLLTGDPLSVASGLLKMCELMSGKRGSLLPAVAFLRPGARIATRVTALLSVADGRAVLHTPARAPYLLGALLAALLGLQVGAQVAGSNGPAFAFVWGTRTYADAPVWKSDGNLWSVKRARARGLKAGALAATSGPISVREEDFPRWARYVARISAVEQASPDELPAEPGADWMAEPLFSGRVAPTSFGIYSLERQRWRGLTATGAGG
jgi:Zn-dependent protease with chaperone function